jgi:hypothetical protein
MVFLYWIVKYIAIWLEMQNLSTFRCVGQIFVSFQYYIKVRSFLTHLGMKLLILFLFKRLLLDV